MGCGTCSSGKDGAPGGCQNNGTCGTGGCNMLNTYNWLGDMVLPAGQKKFDIVEVRFKGSRKEFYHNEDNAELKNGDVVAVEASPGHDVGTVSMVGELVRFQLIKNGLTEKSKEIKKLYRVAKPNELEKWNAVKQLEKNTMHRSREIALQLKLEMKLSDVEFQGDGKKAIFYYTADGRVDFRALIVRLADEFKIRVEMRQIGMRQEASRLGGIGSCGRELCCSTWLTSFKSVSTSAARYQNLSLNPLKLAGQCGKLKCCLNYELDSYLDALKDIPDSGIRLETEMGSAAHRKTDIFKRVMWYAYQFPRGAKGEHADTGEASWVPMPVDRVKEIIALNKQNKKPADLGHYSFTPIKHEEKIGYSDVVGQDSLTRMDKQKSGNRNKKRKNKKKRRPNQSQGDKNKPNE